MGLCCDPDGEPIDGGGCEDSSKTSNDADSPFNPKHFEVHGALEYRLMKIGAITNLQMDHSPSCIVRPFNTPRYPLMPCSPAESSGTTYP